jgi:hypothetical protein
MIIKTKKYALEQNTYINLALRQFFRDNWQWLGIPLGLILLNAILSLTGVYPNFWIYILIVILTILFALFWAVQITGIAQMEQSKPLFQKYVYEIDSRQILMKLNAKEGGILKWDMIKQAVKTKDAYMLYLSNEEALKSANANWLAKLVTRGLAKAQFLYLPFSIFTSEADQKFMDTILRRKNLLVEEKK